MANRYWVTGGNGNWNSATNWSTASGSGSGASVPSTSDAAIFDASSGSGTASLDISPTVQTLTCTGFTGTLAFGTNTISLNSTGIIFAGSTTMAVTGTPLIICTNNTATSRTINPTAVTESNSISFRISAGTGAVNFGAGSIRDIDFTDGTNPTGYAGSLSTFAVTIYGNFKASTGMTAISSANIMTFAATSGIKTITSAGVTFDRNFTFNGVGGTVQLQDNCTVGSTRTVTLTNGTLDLNNKTLSTGLFSSTNSNTRSIAFGTGNIIVTGSNATVWTTGVSTGLTTSGTQVVNSTYSGSTGTRRLDFGNLAEGSAITYNITAGSDIIDLRTTAGSCNNLNFTGFTGSVIGAGVSKTVYGNLTFGTGMTFSPGLTFTLASTSGTKTITTNGVTVDAPLTFDGVGGTWQFADALTQGSTRAFTITNGTIKLKAGATSTVGAFATSGSNKKYLQSTTAGSRTTLSQASGTVNASYLTIKDIAATGGAIWNAYRNLNNIDAGNNIGWDFLSTPVTTTSLSMRLGFGL